MAGVELNGIVDEDDDRHGRAPHLRGRRGRDHEGGERDFFDLDWDRICAYRTTKMVRIKDKFFGALYWGIVTVSILYVIVFVFHIEGKHSEQGTGIGTVITKFQGKGFAGDKVFDGPDLRFPVIEPSGAFIMLRRIVVKDQTPGKCVNWDNPRRCPCPDNSTCTDGYCEVQGWCPSIGDYNVDNPPEGALIENITGLENSVLKITSAIAFPSIGNHFFVTGDSPGATNEFKSIKLGALLQMANPPVDLKELPRGALIGVNFFWNCDVTGHCEPTVVIKRLDGGQGFVQKRSQHKRVDGEERRDAVYMFGLRIVVDSAGVGRRISSPLIVFQIGSCIALLRVAALLVDIIMLYVPLKHQQAYVRCKVETTQDYSDLQDRLNLIKDAETVVPDGRQRREGGRHGAQLSLGMGGQGGSPGTILRGRNITAS